MPPAPKYGHDPKLIERLEAEASRNPGAYRFRLAAIAIAGDFALTSAQVLPWAAPIVIGVLIINTTLFYALGGAAIIFLAWLFRPTFRFEGRPLTVEEAPELYKEMERLKQSLRVPTRMLVYLDDSFNASAAETRGLFGLFGTRCALTLGVPLLVALSREQVLAVIAHEFGHFSRRHGRLGHWLYRARVGWMHYAHYVEESDSAFERAAAWYARKFVPFFSARSFVFSRQCEYEADADAALAVGASACAEALSRISVIARLWEERFPRQLAQWQRDYPEPPHDLYQRFEDAARQCAPGDLQSWLDDALRAPSSWQDTHPSLSERLRSLGQDPLLVRPAESAAKALFGERWAKLSAEFNETWVKEVRTNWLNEHLRIRYIAQPLMSANEAAARDWSVDRKLALARELRRSDPPRGLLELQDLYQANPSHDRIQFAYAAALLNENDETGVELIKTLARKNAAFRAPAYPRLLAYYERKGDSQQAERWEAALEQLSQKFGEAVSLFLEKAEAGEFRLSSLPVGEQTVVSEAARLDPCIAKAWLLEGDAELTYATDRPAVTMLSHLLVLVIDLEEMNRLGRDADWIANGYETLLYTLIPPDEIALVRTHYTTENIPAAYGAYSNLLLSTDAREHSTHVG